MKTALFQLLLICFESLCIAVDNACFKTAKIFEWTNQAYDVEVTQQQEQTKLRVTLTSS